MNNVKKKNWKSAKKYRIKYYDENLNIVSKIEKCISASFIVSKYSNKLISVKMI